MAGFEPIRDNYKREEEAFKVAMAAVKVAQAKKDAVEAAEREEQVRDREREAAALKARVADLDGQLTVANQSQGSRVQVLKTALVLCRALVQTGGPKIVLPLEISSLVQITSEGYPPVVKVSLKPTIKAEVLMAASKLKDTLKNAVLIVGSQVALKANLADIEALLVLNVTPLKLGLAFTADWGTATEAIERVQRGQGMPMDEKYLEVEYQTAANIAAGTGNFEAREFLAVLSRVKAGRASSDLDKVADQGKDGTVME